MPTITIDQIFTYDRESPPADRSLPWQETRNGITVVVEPKPHWASDLLAFNLVEPAYCYYADWCHNGANARFFSHISTCGNDVLRKAHHLISREIEDGLWSGVG